MALDFRISDVYRRQRPQPGYGAELARPFKSVPQRPVPSFQMRSGTIAEAHRFRPQMEPQPMTEASIDRWAAQNRAQAETNAATISEAYEKQKEREIPLLSEEGMRRHPVAAAITLAATKGEDAGEEVKRVREAERRKRLEEQSATEREEDRRAEAELRAAKMAALRAPAPEGMARDPATGRLYKTPKAELHEEDLTPEQRKSYTVIGGEAKPLPKPEKPPKPEKYGATPPPGEKAPAGMIWVPHKGWQSDPTYEKPTAKHAIVGEITSARGRIAKYRQRMSELDQLDAASEGQPPAIQEQMRKAHAEEREQIKEAEKAERELIHDREQELLGRTGPEDYTAEEWAELTPEEQAAYLRAHPGFRPTRHGFDARP